MAMTVTETQQGGYLCLTVEGAVDYTSGETIHKELIPAVQRNSGSLILIDVTGLKGRPDILQSLQSIDAIPMDRLTTIRKIAVLDTTTDHYTRTVAESMMGSRGLHIKWFIDKDTATTWLME
jgi:hypothetical protein